MKEKDLWQKFRAVVPNTDIANRVETAFDDGMPDIHLTALAAPGYNETWIELKAVASTRAEIGLSQAQRIWHHYRGVCGLQSFIIVYCSESSEIFLLDGADAREIYQHSISGLHAVPMCNSLKMADIYQVIIRTIGETNLK